MIRSAAVLIIALAVPVSGSVMAGPMAAGGKLVMEAKRFGAVVEDRALAALYDRLFALQDLRRAAEVKSETAEFIIDDLAKAYKRLDRFVDKELLKEIAVDPSHRRYPGITERSKLDIVNLVRQKIRIQEIAAIEVEKIERDMDDVKRMIEEHLKVRAKF